MNEELMEVKTEILEFEEDKTVESSRVNLCTGEGGVSPSSLRLPNLWYMCSICHVLLNNETSFLSHSSKHLEKEVIHPNRHSKGQPSHSETRPCNVAIKRIEDELAATRVDVISPFCLLPKIQNLGLQRKDFNTQEKKKEAFVCSICSKSCSTKGNLGRHMLLHSNERAFHCHLCKYQAIQMVHLMVHIRSRHSHLLGNPTSKTLGFERSLPTSYKCSDCGIEFAREGNLNRHCQKLLHNRQPSMSERQLFKKLILLPAREEPSTSIDPGNTVLKPVKPQTWKHHSVICGVCGKEYCNSSSLKRHNLIHTGQKPYKCSFCPLQFKQSCHLKSHFLKKHRVVAQQRLEDQKRYVLYEIPSGKNNKPPNLTLVNKAKVRIVRPPQPLVCQECGSQFCSKESLVRHTLIHRGIKPFQCDLCNLSFRQPHHLVCHKRRYHSSSKSNEMIDVVHEALAKAEAAVEEDSHLILGF